MRNLFANTDPFESWQPWWVAAACLLALLATPESILTGTYDGYQFSGDGTGAIAILYLYVIARVIWVGVAYMRRKYQ